MSAALASAQRSLFAADGGLLQIRFPKQDLRDSCARQHPWGRSPKALPLDKELLVINGD